MNQNAAAGAGDPVKLPRHFYSLDAVRGVAALAVVFWHWQHFFQYPASAVAFDATRQPLYAIFSPLYNEGVLAVSIFFSLSGFVFFWLYGDKVESKLISGFDFAKLRFSRLYPLHLVTLLVVAGGQYAMQKRYGMFFIYQYNNWKYFILQLFMASNWGFEKDRSFNGPIWSVSVEVLLYGLFFLVCRTKLRRWWMLAIYAGIGLILMKPARTYYVGGGVFSFFLGGLSYYAFLFLQRRKPGGRFVTVICFVTACLWIIIPVLKHYDFVHRTYMGTGWNGNEQLKGDIIRVAESYAAKLCYQAVLFPLTIITLALAEVKRGTLGRRLAFLGHLSYSSYLLHFPLQLGLMALILRLGLTSEVFYSPSSLILFFLLLIPASLASYFYFERPAQAFLRGKS